MSRVLITGGGTGIGLGIATALIEAGHTVLISGRRPDVLAAAAERIGAIAVPGDITVEPEEIIAAAGPLDHLVNNAGHYIHAPVGALTAEAFAGLYAVHVIAPALLSQAFAAQATGPGAIVNIASTLAERPAPGAAAYGAAKAGLVALTRQLALELAPQGLRANALLPGIVPTAMTETDDPARTAAMVALHPIGRLGMPGDIGEAVAWLLGASWVTGAAIPIDGGLLVRE
ncbi:MAG: NAD(P)-dependent dehydrogenase (short-subunit alcohol dehydrogenase family) [Myxococcota bacterium]